MAPILLPYKGFTEARRLLELVKEDTVTLSVVIGLAGAILVLVALVGGGFTFSGSVMPTVGRAARIPCFVVGGMLIFVSIGLATYDAGLVETTNTTTNTTTHTDTAAPKPDPAPPPVEAAPPTDDPAPPTDPTPAPPDDPEPVFMPGTWQVLLPTYVYELPYSSSAVVGAVIAGDIVEIVCTEAGEWVVNIDGIGSDLWDNVGYGYVPDVVVDTGTSQAVAPAC